MFHLSSVLLYFINYFFIFNLPITRCKPLQVFRINHCHDISFKEIIVNYNSESLALILFSISSYFLASHVKNQKKREILLFSIFLGLLILTRNVFLYFVPFFLIVLLIFGYEKKNYIKKSD